MIIVVGASGGWTIGGTARRSAVHLRGRPGLRIRSRRAARRAHQGAQGYAAVMKPFRRGLVLECAPAPSVGGMTSMAVADGRYLGISEVAESTGSATPRSRAADRAPDALRVWKIILQHRRKIPQHLLVRQVRAPAL